MAREAPILVGLRLTDRALHADYRRRNWGYARARWEAQLGWPIHEGHYDDEPFSLARASNLAAAQAEPWDVAFYVGADFILDDGSQAEAAIWKALHTGQLVFAHDTLVQLEADETEALIEAGPVAAPSAAGIRHRNTFSGALAIPRPLWQKVGGFDERFVGWGWDDISFWAACETLGGGFQRVAGTMYHLWHPRSRAENEDSPEHPDNEVLGRRYLAARHNRNAMLAILAERGER